MASELEAMLTDFAARLASEAQAHVLRNSPMPEEVGEHGVIILHDGDPGEPEVTLSPLMYHYDHVAELNVFSRGEGRQGAYEAIKAAISAAIESDRTLGGRCDWIEARAPEPVDLRTEGGGFKAAVISVVIYYATPDPLG